MKIKSINTEKDFNEALKRLEIIFDTLPNTLEGNEAENLSLLIEKFEDIHYPIN